MNLIGKINLNQHKPEPLKERLCLAKKYSLNTTHVTKNSTFRFQENNALNSFTSFQLKNESHNIFVIALGRVSNKVLLCKKLKISKNSNIAQLTLACYLKWGKNFIKKIKSDAQFFILDHSNSSYIATKSPLSKNPIYYHLDKQENTLYISTQIPLLREYINDCKLNEEYLKGICSKVKSSTETCYEKIHFVPTAHTLLAHNHKIIIDKFWSFYRINPVLWFVTKKYAYKKCRTLMVKALLSTLPNTEKYKIGCELSGGLDSSAVTSLTYATVNSSTSQGKANRNIYCYSSFPKIDPSFKALEGWNFDDSHLVNAILDTHENLHSLTGNQHDISYEELGQSAYEWCGRPHAVPHNGLWLVGMYKTFNLNQIYHVQSGASGNATVSYDGEPNKYINLIKKVLNVFKPAASKKNKKEEALKTFQRQIKNINKIIALNPTHKTSRLINSDTALKVEQNPEVKLKTKPYLKTIKRLLTPHAQKMKKHFYGYDLVETILQGYRAQFGFEHIDITRDQELAEFCLELPNRIFCDRKSTRNILRECMKDLLPISVLSNTTRGQQGGNWYYALKDAIPYFDQRLPQFKKNTIINRIFDMSIVESLYVEFKSADYTKLDPDFLMDRYLSALTRWLHICDFILYHEKCSESNTPTNSMSAQHV